MAIIEDVEVQIVSTNTGQALSEYDSPDSGTTAGAKSVEKYIQAETDTEFHMRITLKKGFNYYGADGVQVCFNMDGGVLSRSKFFQRPRATKDERLREHYVYTIDKTTISDGDVWKRIHYSFNAFAVDEDLDTPKSTLDKQSKILGSIAIEVDRVMRRKLGCDKRASYDANEWIQMIDNKLLPKSISHTVQASRAILISEPKPNLHQNTPIAAKHGKDLKFMFRYRSHLALQTIGCIQRTPSPGLTRDQAPLDSQEQEKGPELALIKTELEALRRENINLTNANSEILKRLDQVEKIEAGVVASAEGGSADAVKGLERRGVIEGQHDPRLFWPWKPDSPPYKRRKSGNMTGDE